MSTTTAFRDERTTAVENASTSDMHIVGRSAVSPVSREGTAARAY